jgi:Ca2+-binding RTX toxin-like protein
MRLILPLTLAAVLFSAPSALANTVVSRDGNIVHVTDPISLGDKRMEVHVTRVGSEIKVTDDVGAINTHDTPDCRESGAAVFCDATGLTGLKLEGGNQNDVIESDVNLPTTVSADDGDDHVTTGPADDVLHGDDGNDSLHAGDGNDVFTHEKGVDRMDGDAGRDTVSYAAAPSAVTLTLDDDVTNDGIASERDRLVDMESAIGSEYPDTMTGSVFNNTLSGRGGDDELSGMGGNDVFNGGAGADEMVGGPGSDTVTYEDRTVPVTVTLEHDADDGQANEGDDARVETVRGGSAGDDLTGSPGANTLDGNGGDDTIDGGLGADKLEGDSGFDTADYGNRTDNLEISLNSLTSNDDGGAADGPLGARDDVFGFEKLIGGLAADTLIGTDFADFIVGGAGKDAVSAGGGDDKVKIDDGLSDGPVDCGDGYDVVDLDPSLDVVTGCETAGGLF